MRDWKFKSIDGVEPIGVVEVSVLPAPSWVGVLRLNLFHVGWAYAIDCGAATVEDFATAPRWFLGNDE